MHSTLVRLLGWMNVAPDYAPLAILAIGVVVVLTLIIALRVHAFLALVAAAMIVSLLSDDPDSKPIERVAVGFGVACGRIAIVIGLAAVVGECMMQSGAADRIVRSMVRFFGVGQASVALMIGGYILSVPVFFDTVFYLMIPLARSMYRQTGRNFLLYAMAIAAGGAATHTMVPPTPGPLGVAAQLHIPLGLMILVGVAVSLPMAILGELVFSRLVNRWMPIPVRPIPGLQEPDAIEESRLPSLGVSLVPIALPVALIAGNTILQAAEGWLRESAWAPNPRLLDSILATSSVFGDANLALFLATAFSLRLLQKRRGWTLRQLEKAVESSLMSAGVIILITAGGGAFGEMLRAAKVGPAVEKLFTSGDATSGMTYLLLAYGLAAVLKVAQGSSTVAMLTTAGLFAGIIGEPGAPGANLAFHPVYIATAISSGSLMGSWMNDSGFWVFAKMSGLSDAEALKSWTPLLAFLSCVGLAATVALAHLAPLL